MSRLLGQLIGTVVLLACGSATCFAEGACAVHRNEAPTDAKDIKAVCVVNLEHGSLRRAAINRCGGHEKYNQDQDRVCDVLYPYFPTGDGQWNIRAETDYFFNSTCGAVAVAFGFNPDGTPSWRSYGAVGSSRSEAESNAYSACNQEEQKPGNAYIKRKCAAIAASACDTMPKGEASAK